jgi:serine/threonine protein kinase
MFCSRCGTEVQQSTQFCPTCGLDLRTSAPVAAWNAAEVNELEMTREALAGEYELVEELGRGGMAVVYRAREVHLEREVAVKVLPFSLGFDADFVERFLREARTAARLEHPNIIPVYRVGRTGRVTYFAMKYLRGGSLARVMHERKRLAPAELRKLMIDVASALGHAHKQDVVHRDIKPDNIMFDEHGVCVVTDFGIARAASKSRLTGTGMAIGTPHYMSPEQARAQSIDGRSDLYSLGIVAYHALVGELPYDGEDSFAIGVKHIMEPIPVPLLDTPDERRLFEVIKRLMAKDPFDRYQTAEELVSALQGQPVAPMFGGPATPPGRRLSQSQVIMAGQSTTPLPAAQVRSPSPSARPSVSAPRPSQAMGSSSGEVPQRPVMRRSVAATEPVVSGRWVPWLIAALVIAGFVVGGLKLYQAGYLGGAPTASPVPPTSDTTAAALPPAGLAGPGPLTDPGESLAHTDSAARALENVASAAREVLGPVAPAPVVTDSGVLRLRGLPVGSQVMVDGARPAQGGAAIKLPARWHELAISAPGQPFFRESVLIRANDTLLYTPNLNPQPGTAPPPEPDNLSPAESWRRRLAALDCDNPGPANQFGRRCYDERPMPQGSLRVRVPAGVAGTPEQVVLVVKVSSAGRTVAIRTLRPSTSLEFTNAVELYAKDLRWSPAKRAGQPVDGWTQVAFLPDTP